MLGGGQDEMGGPAAAAALSNTYDDEIDPSFLQRSMSAPPATEHGLANADRLPLDYYYYYYQPNNLNPRLPKTTPPAPGIGGGGAMGLNGLGGKGLVSQDDSVLFTHFPQPSKAPLPSSLVADYVASLDSGASSSASPSGGAGSQPQAHAQLHAPMPGPGPVDVLPLRPSPIGTRLGAPENDKSAKSLIDLIQEDFPRTPSPVYQATAGSTANLVNAINLGMATANGTVTGGASGSSGKLSPPRPNSAYHPSSGSSQGGGSAAQQQAQAQPGPAPARASSGGPGSGPLPVPQQQQRAHHKSHSAGNLLAASMQGLSLATPAEDMLGPHPGPDLGLGGGMRGAHPHHPDLDGHLAAARQQGGPPGSAQQRLMYQQMHDLHDPSGNGLEFAAGPQGGYVLAGGAAPMYAEQPVYFRVAPPQGQQRNGPPPPPSYPSSAGGPYRQDLMYARVPAEYVGGGDVRGRLHSHPEYVSVIPMPPAQGAGQPYVGWGPHGQRIVAAPPQQFPTREVAGGPPGRLAFPYHPSADVFSHGRLQQEAHERGFKLVPKDMPLHGVGHRDEGPLGGGRKERSGGGRHLRERERMGGVSSSSTLDDFRNNTKNRPWDIRDISGDIVEFCQDQHGSRFIQQKLEMASDEEKELIFKEVLPRAHTLMTDVFGNYVIQKVLEHGTMEQRDVIASILTGHAVQLALQMYGCRVVQKALEVIGVQRLLSLVAEFEGHVLKCVHDQNGNHVIQKCIEVLSLKTKESPEYASFLLPQVDFIVQAFVGQVEKFSTHPYGCRVIQRILEHCTGTQKNVILDEIRKCTGTLIQDQYGNYVIQHVMKHGRPQDRQMVINEVKSRMLLYSQHKFASNVVEKCLQYGSKAERNDIIEEVVRSVLEKSSLLQVMVRDPYGNYVVQKILDIADDRQQEALCSYLKHHAAQLKRYTYGKHILVRLEKISGEKML